MVGSKLAAVCGALWLLGTAPAVSAAAPRKRALLVAVVGYNRGRAGDAAELHTKADVTAIRSLLIHRYGFAPGDITVLATAKETTHQAIVQRFRSALISPAQPGDIVYFHYSGHGAQVKDKYRRKLNGMHECLVPSDYVSEYEQKKGGPKARIPFANYILDDEIRNLLSALKAKEPGNVTLSFDSCFSGTITRGRLPVRGLGLRDVYIPPRGDGGAPVATRGGAAEPEAKGPGGLLARGIPERLGYAVISATTSSQEEPETMGDNREPMGLLSWALTRVLARPAARMTYRGLAERLATLTTQRFPDRMPQVEGYLDRAVLGTETHPPQRFVPVSVKGAAVLLNAGTLHGITTGSRFAIYPSDTKEPAGKPLAEGTVGGVEPTLARLELDAASKGRVALDALKNTRAFETRHQFGDERLRVDASALHGDPRWKAIAAALRAEGIPEEQQGVVLVNGASGARSRGPGWDVRLLLGKDLPAAARALRDGERAGPRDVVLVREDGTPFSVAADGPQMAAVLREKLEGAFRWRLVNQLTNPSAATEMGVKVEIVRAHPTAKDLEGNVTKLGPTSELTRAPGGQLELIDGDYIQLRITNTGRDAAYITVLDLRPDGKIAQVYPLPEETERQANRFAAGQSQVLPLPYVYRLEPPHGVELFKAIATNKHTDFHYVVSRDLARSRGGNLTPLQKLLRSATLGIRSVNVGAVASEYAVDQLPFVVKAAGTQP